MLAFGEGVIVSLYRKVRCINQSTHQHQVDDRLGVDPLAKVLVVTTREACANTVVRVHHTRNSVKAEAIELVLLHVEAKVGEEEAEDLMRTVVEKAAVGGVVSAKRRAAQKRGYLRVPKLVLALGSSVEVVMVRAVKVVQTIVGVDGSVRVDNVEEHGDTHTMCGVDELHQVLGRSCNTP